MPRLAHLALLALVASVACAASPLPVPVRPVPAAGPPARLECPSGRGDCDGEAANGCEVDLASDPDNCHVCGHSCRAAHSTGICFEGVCRLLGCDPGYGDCDHLAENGCETELCYTSQGWTCHRERCGGYGYGY